MRDRNRPRCNRNKLGDDADTERTSTTGCAGCGRVRNTAVTACAIIATSSTGLYAVKLNLGYEIETEVKVGVVPVVGKSEKK